MHMFVQHLRCSREISKTRTAKLVDNAFYSSALMVAGDRVCSTAGDAICHSWPSADVAQGTLLVRCSPFDCRPACERPRRQLASTRTNSNAGLCLRRSLV